MVVAAVVVVVVVLLLLLLLLLVVVVVVVVVVLPPALLYYPSADSSSHLSHSQARWARQQQLQQAQRTLHRRLSPRAKTQLSGYHSPLRQLSRRR